MDRIAMLTEILQVQPNDAFARYGLALALSEAGRTDEALAEFERLEAGSPDYVPGYQMAGQLLVKLGRPEEAKEALIRGWRRRSGRETGMHSRRCRLCWTILRLADFVRAVMVPMW